jgi:hypothetical protein
MLTARLIDRPRRALNLSTTHDMVQALMLALNAIRCHGLCMCESMREIRYDTVDGGWMSITAAMSGSYVSVTPAILAFINPQAHL